MVYEETHNPRIDSHVHIWPDSLAQRNLETIKERSGVSPAFNGTVSSLITSMKDSGIHISIVNNLVLSPKLMKKANDWTAQTISNHPDLIGMGWVIAGEPESGGEITRCIKELKFRAIKIHHSHSKIFPDDPRNYQVYERISEYKVPVLFHCGKNPYPGSSVIQFSAPSGFRSVLSSFSQMKVIMGHLAGYEDYPKEALDVLSSFRNVYADTAIASLVKVNIKELVPIIGIEKFVFGSDYPIYDPASTLSWIRHSVSESELHAITCKNAKPLFGID